MSTGRTSWKPHANEMLIRATAVLVLTGCGHSADTDIDSGPPDDAAAADATMTDAGPIQPDAAEAPDAGIWPADPQPGQFAFARVFPGDVYAVRMAVATDGSLGVAGTAFSALDFGDISLPHEHPWDLFAASIEPDGSARWARRFSGSGQDMTRAIAVSPTGHLLVTGQYSSTDLEFDEGPSDLVGGDDAFIVALDQIDGSVAWSRVFGTPLDDAGHALVVDDDGDIVWVGVAQGVIDVGGGPIGSDTPFARASMVLARFTAEGEHRWSRAIVGANSPFTRLAIGPDGQIVIAGDFFGTVDFGGTVLDVDPTGVTDRDSYLAAYDESGNLMFARGIRDQSASYVSALAVAADTGEIWLAGNNSGGDLVLDDGQILATGFDDNAYVAQFDAGGTFLSGREFGSASDDYPLALAMAPDGGVYASILCRGPFAVGGITIACAELGQSSALLRLDRNGNVVWSSTVSANNFAWIEAIGRDNGPAVYVAGDTSGHASFDGVVLTEAGLFVGAVADGDTPARRSGP